MLRPEQEFQAALFLVSNGRLEGYEVLSALIDAALDELRG